MSKATTRGVYVEVESQYMKNHSIPEQKQWLFSYRITIRNDGDETVQLLSRHWIITNALGATEEVRGPGVIGKQPILEPGQSFEYTSFCPLDSQVGSMQGTFQMKTLDGEEFDAEIAPFTLATPYAFN